MTIAATATASARWLLCETRAIECGLIAVSVLGLAEWLGLPFGLPADIGLGVMVLSLMGCVGLGVWYGIDRHRPAPAVSPGAARTSATRHRLYEHEADPDTEHLRESAPRDHPALAHYRVQTLTRIDEDGDRWLVSSGLRRAGEPIGLPPDLEDGIYELYVVRLVPREPGPDDNGLVGGPVPCAIGEAASTVLCVAAGQVHWICDAAVTDPDPETDAAEEPSAPEPQ